ncbi:MAG TPA: hypothetical protein VGS20_09145 [Candidatus Acidoferrales bacterium]|nr:hypothetical protein [Candidatus Acidoferrales bacterium]
MKITMRRLFMRTLEKLAAFTAVFAGAMMMAPLARAVPSYSRQTGFPCKSCHTTPPELTPLGRVFKLNGYTIAGAKKIESKRSAREAGLGLLEWLPLSALFDTSFSSTRKPQPTTQNGNFEFPQAVSLFLSGAWSDHVGSFVQVTYHTQANTFSWDNTDLRYANSRKVAGKDLVYGVTLNNNPSVEDLWNDTPAWGFPWIASDVAPSPIAAAIVNGKLAQDVAGLGGYAMWNNHLYADGTIYRSEHIGGTQPSSGAGFNFNIRGVAPYWRLAWQQGLTKNDYLEIGTYGMHLKSSPNAITGLEDGYTDWAVDFQYDRTLFQTDVLSLRGNYIRENSALDATFALGGAAQPGHHLNTFLANGEYHFGNRFSGTLGWFNVTGTPDPLLYASTAVTGSANGDPRSSGYILNGSWWAMQNIDLAVQYTGYLRFNGGRINYDGFGRDAGANNSIYLLARFIF